MALDLATIGVAFETSGLEKGMRAFNDNEQAANRAADAADKMGKDTESTFSMVRRVAVALSGVIASIKMGGAFAKITSEMTDYEVRLARVVGGADEASRCL